MATVNFYLVNPKNEESVIKLTSYLNKKLFNYSFGVSIPVKQWDAINQRVKKSFAGSLPINSIMDKIEGKVKELDNKAVMNGQLLTADDLRHQLNIMLGKTEGNQTMVESLVEHLELFIEKSKTTKEPNTIKKYNTLKFHLENYEKNRKKMLLIKEVDSIYDSFSNYLIKQGLVNQSIGKYIQAYKVFVNDMIFHKVIPPVNLKPWKVERKPGTVIVLNQSELKSIEETNNLTERLIRAKHLFLFSCYSGLRYSDVMNLNKANVNGKYLTLTTVKTKEQLQIPLSNQALAILKIYKNEFPKISNQKLNEAIKDLCEVAGLKKEVEIISFSGIKRITTTYKKYELVSFHTGRKTCITSLLKKGLGTEIIQRIVGIEDYRTMKFYINLNDEKDVYKDFFKLVN